MQIGKRDFDIVTKTYVMGILNRTPDSFSDGGKYENLDHALRQALQMVEEGADIIDIGGESTRPGHVLVSEAEEMARVIPLIERLSKEIDIPISIDTWKASVAEASICAGAALVNDVWGLKKDKKMAGVIAKYGVPCCLMHNREIAMYNHFMEELIVDLKESIDLAQAAGILKSNIILDPGIGFGKTLEQNLEVMGQLERLHVLALPVLLGTSRKSMIGLTLELPTSERLEGTLATTVVGVMKGVSFVRVHDVQANKRAIAMTEAMMRYKR